jgi:hypothetical protein
MPMSEHENVRAYAIRRVNPFLGVLQIIETLAGRAISANGIVWDIEVLTEYNDGWGILNSNTGETAYYRYGLWSQEGGLVSRPLASQFDSGLLEQKADDLVQTVRERLDQLPFQLVDTNELWLFDSTDEQPIALLASCIDGIQRPSSEPRYWNATSGQNGVASQRRFPGSTDIETLVNRRAGPDINRHWVVRNENGTGLIEENELLLDAGSFPPFLLTEEWSKPDQHELVSEYLYWIAPSLLTLQNLAREQREQLESCLDAQAISVEHHWRLYPCIIDQQKLNTARVQGRLLKARLN